MHLIIGSMSKLNRYTKISVGVERVGAKGLGCRVFEYEECGFRSSFNCAKGYGGVPAARVK